MYPTIRTPAQRRVIVARLARLEERLGELMTLRADLEEALGTYDSQGAPTQTETPAAESTDAR